MGGTTRGSGPVTRPSLALWLWPLVLPTLLPIISALMSLMDQWKTAHLWAADALPGLLPGFGVTVAVTLAVTLTPALVALLMLRSRADSDNMVRQRLLALWGFCLGLSLTWVLFFVLPSGSRPLLLNVLVWPPLLGYVAGRWAGGSR